MDMFSSAALTERERADPTAGAQLLIVDDSRTNLQVMGKRLTRMGYVATLCDNGIEALDLMQARRFDCVLVDMMMPGLSGTAMLRELRATVGLADTPVIMITGRSDDAAVIEALAAGADDHLAKPFAFDVLGARIERLIERARAHEALRRSNAALDARIAHRAMELGELKSELAQARIEIAALQAQLSGETTVSA